MQKREEHFEKMHFSFLQGYNEFFTKIRLNNNASVYLKNQIVYLARRI